MITAKEAKNLSETANEKKALETNVSNMIEEAAKKGRDSTEINKGYLPEFIKEQIRLNGFEMECLRDVSYCTIKWMNANDN